VPEFEPRASLVAPELEWLASLSQEQFSAAFRGSAVKRAKWRGLVRNACVALGNSGVARDRAAYARVIQLLDRLASSDDPIVADHARWALDRLAVQESAASD
jgi:epoxyqueuosine reductase